jgi:hypothetical protein
MAARDITQPDGISRSTCVCEGTGWVWNQHGSMPDVSERELRAALV